MRPAFDEGVATKDLFYFAGRRGIQMKELHVMSGIHFMNRYDVGSVIIKCGEPFLLFLLRPILFCRCDVVVSLSGTLLERTGSVHRGKGRGAQILRGLFYFRANLGGN